ncbi:signal peptidase II [Patescibacteria group bacterium]
MVFGLLSPRAWQRRLFLLVSTGIIIVVDQLSKQWALDTLKTADNQEISISPLLSFNLTENTGLAFSIPITNYLYIGLFVVALIIIWFVAKATMSRSKYLGPIAIGLILGGAAGNFIDRIRFGAVIDYIDFLFFPIFNLADLAILGGVLVTLYILIKKPKKRQKVSTPKSDAPEVE